MVLKIRLGREREKRLKKHLEKEHPGTKGHSSVENIEGNKFSTKIQIDRILDSSPNFKCQLLRFTKV